MRLPQSSNQPLSIRVFALTIALLVVFPVSAGAATQQLICSSTSLKFGTVTVGQSETQFISLTNVGQTTVTVSALSVNVSEFSVSSLSLPADLAAGQTVALSVIFAPTATGWTGGKVTFTSNASNASLQLQLAGTGVTSEALTATPASLSFGQVSVGTSASLSVVLTNAHTWKDTLTAFQATGTGFSLSGPTLPVTLNSGQSVTLTITFTPPAAGLTGGSVFVSGPSLNIPLTGTGTTMGQLTVAPTTLNFGSVLLGATGMQTTTLSATGGSVTISSAASSNSQFALSGASFPLMIGSGQSVPINVSFTPQTSGVDSASLTFLSNATNSRASESLAGTGTAPQVSLAWSASTSQVSGYNVYRRVAPNGSYGKINSALDPTTSFLDTTVPPGQTYDYATTAVTSSGEESGYSNQVEIAVP
jgi:hypothetical protein